MSISIYTNVDVDIEDVIDEIPTERLRRELEARKADPVKIPEGITDEKMKRAIAKWLQLREWEVNDQELFIERLKEKLF